MAAKEIASKKLKQTWTTAVFALALKQTKNKIWSSSLSANADVKKGTTVLEQHASYVTEANPLGVGAHVGIVEHDGVDPDKKADKDSLDVLWFDKQRIACKQVLCWQCPPKGTVLQCIRDPEHPTKLLRVEIDGYSPRGVSLLVQHVGFVGKKTAARKKKSTTVAKNKKSDKDNEKPKAVDKDNEKPKATSKKRHSRKRSNSLKARTAKNQRATRAKNAKKQRQQATREKLAARMSGDSDSEDQCVRASKRWSRFRRDKLPAELCQKLVEEVNIREDEICDLTFDKYQWIPFLNRVAREYTYLHSRRYKNDAMHLHREEILAAAVSAVLGQLKPLVVKPMDGNRDEIVAACQRMIETAFGLSGKVKEEKPTSQRWIATKVKTGKYSCRECDEHHELMDAKVNALMNKWIKKGSPTGAYKLKPGQEVPGPDALYQLSERRVGRRRATVCQRAIYRCSSVIFVGVLAWVFQRDFVGVLAWVFQRDVCRCSGVDDPA